MHDLTIALVLIGVFMTCCGIAYGILGFGLPLSELSLTLTLDLTLTRTFDSDLNLR